MAIYNGETKVAGRGNATLSGLGITATSSEINKIDGFTGTKDDLNYAKDLNATGVTSTEYDYLEGTTSNIQDQIDDINDEISNPNLFINGNFDVWQRGTSGFTDFEMTADRWIYNLAGVNSTNAQRSDISSSSGIPYAKYSLAENVTWNPQGSGIYAAEIYQTIHSSNAKLMAGKEMTFSCFLSVSPPDDFEVSFIEKVPSATDNYTTHESWFCDTDTQELHYGWTKIKYTFTVPTESPINSYSVDKGFAFGMYVKYVGTTSLTEGIEFAQMKLEYGDTATKFIPKTYEEELTDCQRYYQKGYLGNHMGVGDGTAQFAFTVPVVPQMVSPTCRFYVENDMYAHQLSDGTSVVKVMSAGDYDEFNASSPVAGIFIEGLSGMTDDAYSINDSSTSGNVASGAVNYYIEGEPWMLK